MARIMKTVNSYFTHYSPEHPFLYAANGGQFENLKKLVVSLWKGIYEYH